MALVAGLGATACSSQTDAQPTVASVNFDPRLVIVADDANLTAEAGPRDGAEQAHDDAAGWSVPDGSVLQLRVEGARPHRILGERSATDGGDPTPLVDTGELQPGDDVTVALTEPGDVAFTFADSPEPLITVRVVPAG
jgi:hypothetical protein